LYSKIPKSIKMFTRSTKTTVELERSHKELISLILDQNVEKVKEKINTENVNDVLNSINQYTALHYAIYIRDIEIIYYILSLSPKLDVKTSNEKDIFDAFDLSTTQKNFVLKLLLQKENQLKQFEKEKEHLHSQCSTLRQNNIYLTKSIDDYMMKNNILKKTIKDIKKLNQEISLEKKDLEISHSQLSFQHEMLEEKYKITLAEKEEYYTKCSTVEKEKRILKRKYDDLEQSNIGLIDATRK